MQHPPARVVTTAIAEGLVSSTIARSVPLAAQVDLTMRCNERCLHCYRVVESRPELTADEIERVLGELARAGTLYLTFSGGEIFLRSDLFRLIERARRLRFDVRLKTNALLVDDAAAARVRALGVRQVDVSLYGAAAPTHDAITQVRGSFARTLDGVRSLRAAGVKVKLAYPLMSVNVAELAAVRRLATELGAAVGVDPMITARNDGHTAPVALRLSGGLLQRFLAETPPPPSAAPAADAPEPGHGPTIDDVPCSAAHNACYVSAYGDVMPCVAMPVACGNVREESFDAIWQRSTKMLEVRAIRVSGLRGCSDCDAARFCTRCPGQALIEDGDLHGPSQAACEHAVASARAAGSTATPPLLSISARPLTLAH